MPGTAASKTDENPAAKRFWAIRACSSLQAPAIFTAFEDCSFYLDESENDNGGIPAEFESFDTISQAVAYIGFGGGTNNKGALKQHPSSSPSKEDETS